MAALKAKRKRMLLEKLEELSDVVDNLAHHTALDSYDRILREIIEEIIELLPE
jgi:hypothetical protein